MSIEQPDHLDAYNYAKQVWQWWHDDPQAPDMLDPRDPYDAIEGVLERGYDHHPIQARYITGLALQSLHAEQRINTGN